jgi:hypothetical protein
MNREGAKEREEMREGNFKSEFLLRAFPSRFFAPSRLICARTRAEKFRARFSKCH